jgi:hypothetical protein
MANWNRQTRTNLYENQWGMLSPVFAVGEHGHINRYELCEHDVLPFKKRSGPAKRPLTGGQGEVIKVDIDPGHHNFYDGIFGREVRNHKSIYAVSVC